MLRSISAALFLGAMLSSSAHAQGVVAKKDLSLGLARIIADAALAECKAKGFVTAVAVVDQAGQLIVMYRDEAAQPNQVEMARRKAYTAIAFKMSSLDFKKRTEDPNYAAQRQVEEVLALGGGVPIKVGNDVIGGVASSGAGQEQDDACAKAGIAKAAAQLK